MEAKTIRPQVSAIQKRFFEALEDCIEMGKIAGLQTFVNEYGLHKKKYSAMRSAWRDPNFKCDYKVIDIDSLAYLVKDFNISADWLLTGRGNMRKQK